MSTIQITATTPQPPLQVEDGDVVTFRGWYTNSFVASDGVTPVEGGNGLTGFYYEETCSLNDDGFPVIPALDIQPTTGSNPTAGFLGALFVNGAFNRMIFGQPAATAGWQIPTSPSVTTFGALALYNAAVQLLYPPVTYATYEQVLLAIQEFAGNFQYAAVGINGITSLSAAPVVASEPIALSPTDPTVVFGSIDAVGVVPRSDDLNSLIASQITDDGIDVSIQTLNIVQAGDYQALQNGSFFSVNDSLTEDGGRTVFQAGGDSGAVYAGVTADCSSGIGEVNVQSTGITNLYGANQVTIIGDGKSEQNGTQVIVNDPTRMVIQTAANQIPNDPSIGSEQICFYLDEDNDKLKARIRLSDGSYATWEGTFTRD
jgi:hypothetical protein